MSVRSIADELTTAATACAPPVGSRAEPNRRQSPQASAACGGTLGFGSADKGRTRRTGRSFDQYQSAPGSLKQSAAKPRPIIRITRFLTPVHSSGRLEITATVADGFSTYQRLLWNTFANVASPVKLGRVIHVGRCPGPSALSVARLRNQRAADCEGRIRDPSCLHIHGR